MGWRPYEREAERVEAAYLGRVALAVVDAPYDVGYVDQWRALSFALFDVRTLGGCEGGEGSWRFALSTGAREGDSWGEVQVGLELGAALGGCSVRSGR